METTLAFEQTAAVADSLNGDETSVLAAGVLTVTPANAEIEKTRNTEEARVRFRSSLIGVLYEQNSARFSQANAQGERISLGMNLERGWSEGHNTNSAGIELLSNL